jgi:hypothetical protein
VCFPCCSLLDGVICVKQALIMLRWTHRGQEIINEPSITCYSSYYKLQETPRQQEVRDSELHLVTCSETHASSSCQPAPFGYLS